MSYKRLYGDCTLAIHPFNNINAIKLTNTLASGYWNLNSNWLTVNITDGEPYHQIYFEGTYEGLGLSISLQNASSYTFDISSCFPDGTVLDSGHVKSVTARVVYEDGCYKGDLVELPICTCNHNFISSITKSPTCTSSGEYTFTCSLCSYSYKQSIDPYGHTLTDKYQDDRCIASAATCITDATYYYECTRCSYNSKEEGTYTTWIAEGTALGHIDENNDGICDRDGCGASMDNGGSEPEIPDTPEHTCTFDKEKVEEKYFASAATCTSKAKYYYSCTCGEKGTETFEHGSTVEHSYTKQITTDTYKKSDATCTTKAVYYYCCANCNAKGTETYESGSTLAHNYTRKVATAAYKRSSATCTKPATYYYCCSNCDARSSNTWYSYGDPLTDHIYEWVESIEPTCTESGYELYKCAGCGDEEKRDLRAPYGHDLKYTIINNDKHKVECSQCDYTSEAAHSLTYIKINNSTHTAACTKCTYTNTGGHTADCGCLGTLT